MTRREQLAICRTCLNRQFNPKKGLICSITGDIADFKGTCKNYDRDNSVEIPELKPISKPKRKPKRIPEKITKVDLYLILAVAALNVFMIRLLMYFTSDAKLSTNLLFYSVLVLISISIGLLLKGRDGKKIRAFGDQKFKILFSILFSITNTIYLLSVFPRIYHIIWILVSSLLLTYIVSQLSFLIVKPFSMYRFIPNKVKGKSSKRLLVISISLLFLFGIFESDLFINRETVYWDEDRPVTLNNFRGNPDYFTSFGAAIYSSFDYDYPIHSIAEIEVKSFMYSHHSWVLKYKIDTVKGLRHEQFHFNISEFVSRKFKKTIAELPKEYLDKKTLKGIYKYHLEELNILQDEYDEETNHGSLIEKQKDWEYIIDSMLVEFELWRPSNPLKELPTVSPFGYYRKIEVDAFNHLVERFPIMDSSLVSGLKHYKLFYTNKKLSKIQYWNRNRMGKDELYGVAQIVIDKEEDIEEWSFYDSDGKPVNSKNGIHSIKLHTSSDSLVKTYFNKEGEAIENDEGIHKLIWELDESKRKHYLTQFNLEGTQVADNDGYYAIRYEYDVNNNISKYANYNSNDELASINNGVAYYKHSYDRQNNMTDIYAFDPQGLPVNDWGNSVSFHYRYNLRGDEICVYYKDINGALVRGENGAAISFIKYDKYSNIIDGRDFGLNRNLIISNEGKGRHLSEYDSLGRQIINKNLDAYDELLNDNYGVCMREYSYNEYSNWEKVKRFYADSIGDVYFLKTVLYKYDEKQRKIGESYYDENMNPSGDSRNVFKIAYKYDKRDNNTEVAHYSVSRKLQAVQDGVAIFRYKYDDRGNKLESAYFDENGSLKEVEGVAIDRYVYNSKKQLIERSYYNADNELTKNSDRVEIIRCKYDIKGNTIVEASYDKNRQLSPNLYGIARYVYKYDKDNLNTEIHCYNANGKLVSGVNDDVAKIVFSYSNNKELMKTSYYNSEGKLKNIKEGYAYYELDYDKYGNVLRVSYYDKDRKPTFTSYGYASTERVYDLNGNIVAELYLNENDSLVEDKDGYACYIWVYDRNGEVVRSNGYGTELENLYDINMGPFMEKTKGSSLYNSSAYRPEQDLLITYYDNGQKKSEVMYVNGKPERLYESWYETGELQSTIEYKDGKRNGKCIEYYKNGNISMELYYKNNMLVSGSEQTWYESGELHTKFEDGECLELDLKGNIISTIN